MPPIPFCHKKSTFSRNQTRLCLWLPGFLHVQCCSLSDRPHPLNRLLSVSHTTAENLHVSSQTQPPHHAVSLSWRQAFHLIFSEQNLFPGCAFVPSPSLSPQKPYGLLWVHRGVLAILTHVQLFMTGHRLFLFVFLSFLFIIPKMVYTKTRWHCCRHVKVCLRMNPHLFLAMTQPLDTVCFTPFSSSGFLSPAA